MARRPAESFVGALPEARQVQHSDDVISNHSFDEPRYNYSLLSSSRRFDFLFGCQIIFSPDQHLEPLIGQHRRRLTAHPRVVAQPQLPQVRNIRQRRRHVPDEPVPAEIQDLHVPELRPPRRGHLVLQHVTVQPQRHQLAHPALRYQPRRYLPGQTVLTQVQLRQVDAVAQLHRYRPVQEVHVEVQRHERLYLSELLRNRPHHQVPR